MKDDLSAVYLLGAEQYKRERDEALVANTELGKMYLDAVSALQGCEVQASVLEAQRDALERAMRDIYKHAPMGGHAHHTARKALAELEDS